MWRAPHLPFFLLSSLWAGLVPLVWLWPGRMTDPARWHAQEMVLGVAGAAMAGYLLTALPHWLKEAGRAAAPLAGGRLAALVAVWLAGRLAGFRPGQGALGTALQLAFPLLLSLVLLAAVLRTRLWTRLPVAAAPAAIALAAAPPGDAADGLRPVLVLALVIALVAGRMIPAFLAARSPADGDAGGGRRRAGRDRVFSLPLAVALALHFVAAPERLVGAALVLAGLAEAARPLFWPALRPGLGQGDIRLLLVAWCWLPAGLCLAGAGLFAGWSIAFAGHLHGLTMGLSGSMILAVQSRAAMRRRPGGLAVGAGIASAFALVQLAAATRLAVPLAPGCLVPLSAGLWSAGWALAAAAAARATASPLPHPVLSARRRPA